MSPTLQLRTSVIHVLIYSLIVGELFTFTIDQNHASKNSLPRSLTPPVKESPEKTVPQKKTIDEATRSRASETLGHLPLSFEENRGQVDREVKYISRGSGYTLFLTSTEAVLTLRQSDGKKAAAITDDARRSPIPAQPRSMHTSVVRMNLAGANRSPAVTGESEMGVKTSYFKGNDPENWHTDVSRYERVRYARVYPGIDMIYYGEQQQLEYDFEVAAGADARRIALEFKGVKRMKIERQTGGLILQMTDGEVRQHKPVAYQEEGGKRREVASRYVMKGKRTVGIEVSEYDRTKRLVIDPVLSYSTYLGGNGDDHGYGYGIAVDASGHAYVTGYTTSTDFPTKNQYQTDQALGDAFVVKLDTNASGTASLLYSTFLGGSREDVGWGIAVDASGIAYVTGLTYSPDFPMLHQYQIYQGGRADAFVTKLDTNASGAASLLYSTYLGGSNTNVTYGDAGIGIAVGASGIVYVAGYTESPDFPTVNQFQTYQGGGADAFVAKLDTNASGAASLLYSTCLGGSNLDIGMNIAVDASGIAYVIGFLYSTDFPVLHQYQTLYGGYDTFVTKLDTNVSGAASLLYSTYLGGNADDYGRDIAVDSSGYVYVAGDTGSTDFPTKNQYQTDQGDFDAYITKLDTNASGDASLLYSTYLGGANVDGGFSIAIDSSGNAYVNGVTASTDFPTLNEVQTYQAGGTYGYDAFVTKLNTNASGAASLLYSTYLGGSDDDFAWGIAVDSAGSAYVVGHTASTDFPTLNQYQGDQADIDTFVTKLAASYDISGRVTGDGATGIAGVTVTLSGSQSRTTVTDSVGNYYFINLQPGGDYTVTPSKSGLTFVPPQQSFTNFQAGQTNVNFTTEPVNISGRVTLNTAAGAGLSGVTIKLTRGAGFTPRSVTTASDGTYSFTGVPVPGNYTVTPSKINYSFSPTQIALNNLTANQANKNFVATKTYAIIGTVKLGEARLPGVTVKLTSPTPAGFAPRTTTTNSSGAYAFYNLPAGRDYTVTAMKTGYQFTPTSQFVTNLSANQTTTNFSVKVYSITGRITRTGATTGIGAVTVTLTSPTPAGFAARTVRTDSTGTYIFMTLPAGRNYTIKPVKSGFTFTPAMRSITNLGSNIPAGAVTNFTGTGP